MQRWISRLKSSVVFEILINAIYIDLSILHRFLKMHISEMHTSIRNEGADLKLFEKRFIIRQELKQDFTLPRSCFLHLYFRKITRGTKKKSP